MEVKQSFLLALKSLMANKMRALLTMLGIIIGVAAVILIVGLGNGVTQKVEDVFKEMGSNIIVASAYAQNSNEHIELSKVEEMVANDSNITSFSPYVPATKKVKAGKEEKSFPIDGVSTEYSEIRSKKLIAGRNLEYIDIKRSQKVCVLGYHVMTDLYGKNTNPEDLINEYIRIDGTKFRIVGVLKEVSPSQFSDEDNMVLIPYTTALREFDMKYITTWYYSYLDKDSAKTATDAIDSFFYNIFNDSDKYIIIDAQSIMDNMNSVIETIKVVLVAIACISLLVGGIGIMNIMLVSVTERTREIGIRKAIGANKRDVLMQFVIEAITTSGIGGLLGVLLGMFLVGTVSVLFDVNGSVTIDSVLIASGISVFIGIIFGYLPANKAANLNPIDALRYE